MDLENNIIWNGEWRKGQKINGKGRTIFFDELGNVWDYEGDLIDGKPKDGNLEIFNVSKKYYYEGNFSGGFPNGIGKKLDERKNLIWEGVFKDGNECTGRG